MALSRVLADAAAPLQNPSAATTDVRRVTDRIKPDRDLAATVIDLHDDILDLVQAEQLCLFTVDSERHDLYARSLNPSSNGGTRMPLDDRSVAGFVALNGTVVSLADAHDTAELRRLSTELSFDHAREQRAGTRTTQLLAVPIRAATGPVTGVLQLANKKTGLRFTTDDIQRIHAVARALARLPVGRHQPVRAKGGKFDRLVDDRRMSRAELDTATAEARTRRVPLEAVLQTSYRIGKHELGRALSQYYQCPYMTLDEHVTIQPQSVRGISPGYLKANYWIPVRVDDNAVVVLTDDPHSFSKRQDISRLFPGKAIRWIVGFPEDIARLADTASASEEDTTPVSEILGQLTAEHEAPVHPTSEPTLDENDSAIVRLVNKLITEAIHAGASDIHIEPYGAHDETVIRFRTDGRCYEYLRVPAGYRRALASRIKIMAQLDIAERRKPQDGKLTFRLAKQDVELRVATLPTAGADNEDVVLRVLTSGTCIPLDRLRMSDANVSRFKELLSKPHGILLCVGPTGSGKTTTLHSALAFLNQPNKKIWTAEDPVEITQRGLRQVQVHPKIGFDFAAALRAFLRADPDVIMVGEIRDRETAQMALRASLTGHLVLSTLHTNSAVETVTRLLDMGMDPFNFADALLGVLAQRLARTLCRSCKEPYHPDRKEYEALAESFGRPAFEALGLVYDAGFTLYRATGCKACRQTGYRGRIGLHELLPATDEIKHQIHVRASVPELSATATRQGLVTLLQDGVLKCVQGWTDYAQVQAVAMR